MEWWLRAAAVLTSQPLKVRHNSPYPTLLTTVCLRIATIKPEDSSVGYARYVYCVDLLRSPVAHTYYLRYRYDASCKATRLLRTGPSEAVSFLEIPSVTRGCCALLQKLLI
jgi:hypothetical protein